MKLFHKIIVLAYLSFTTSSPISEVAELAPARIVNGFEIYITEIPYQAALRRQVLSGWAHICGAVIIANNALLTAAHCVDSYEYNPSVLKIVVGTSYRLSGGTAYDVANIIVHESFNLGTLENDIALLVPAKQMSISQSIKPVAYASSGLDLPDGTEALVSGFGTTSYSGSASTVLLAAKVNIVNQVTCARAYLRMASITSGMLCANASLPARDACQGDSGGPLVANDHLIGIVSWGEGCADSVYPGVYTRVSTYSSWIGQKLADIS